MAQANLTRLVSKLRIKIKPVHRNMSNPDGPVGRIKLMRRTVTALFKYERLELTYYVADESRGFVERLISEAVRHGDCHRPTMNLAKFWIEDPALVPKLFKVLVPRYQEWPGGLPYTRMLRAPSNIKDCKTYIFNNSIQTKRILNYLFLYFN
jgi:large subunit ribosomal protein L17